MGVKEVKNVVSNNDRMSVDDELYDEILNGFLTYKKSEKNRIILLQRQTERIRNVGVAFFSSEKTHDFLKDWMGKIGSLKPQSFFDQLEKMAIPKEIKKLNTEEDDIDEDEEELNKSFNLFSMLGVVKWLALSANVIRACRLIKDYYKKGQEIKESYNQYIVGLDENNRRKSNIERQFDFSKLLGDQFSQYFEKLSNTLFCTIDDFFNSSFMKTVIDNLNKKIEEVERKIGWQIAIKAAIFIIFQILGLVFTGGTANVVVGWAQSAYLVGSAAHTAYSGIEMYKKYKDFYRLDAQENEKLKQQIQIITNKWNSYAQNLIDDKHEEINVRTREVIEEALSTNVIKQDVSTILDFSKDVYENYIKRRRQGVNDLMNGGLLYQGGQMVIEKPFSTNVEQYLSQSFLYKYNIKLDFGEYKKIFDDNDGLMVVKVIQRWKNDLASFAKTLYNSLKSFVEVVGDNLLKTFEEQWVSFEFDGFYDNQVSDQSVQQNEKTPSSNDNTPTRENPPVDEVGRVRLSDRTSQPFLPIFENGYIRGFTLSFITEDDRDYKVTFDNLLRENNTSDLIVFTGDSKKKLSEIYVKRMERVNSLLSSNLYQDMIQKEVENEEILKSIVTKIQHA